MSTPFKFDCNVAKLIQLMDNNKINYEGAVQRGYVWDNKRKSRLIRSIILGRAIGMFNFNQLNKNEYEALDGKQRSNAIREFVKGNYSLHASILAIIDENEEKVELAKRKFEHLSESIQNTITSYGLLIYCYDNLSIENKREIFEDINNGRPVTATEITRVNIKSKEIFQELARHKIIEIGVSKASRDKNIHEDIVTQMWSICYNENPSLLNAYVRPILESTEVSQKQKQELNSVLDYIGKLYYDVGSNKRLARKMRTKVHIVSLAYMAFIAIRKGISSDEFSEKAITFFNCEGNKATISNEYNESIGSGSAKAENVGIRKREVEKALL